MKKIFVWGEKILYLRWTNLDGMFNKRITLLLWMGICTLVCVGQSIPKHELRGTWFTTVLNSDWPADSVRDASLQQRQMCELLDSVKQLHYNAVFFQIRTTCDALYPSSYEPWSSFLNNGRGVSPKYDPLAFCIRECHKRGLTCHGWINPYRYAFKKGWTDSNDVAQNYVHTHPDWLLTYKNTTILDPGNPEVLQRIKDVVGEVIHKYDIDGIIMDDYFYPYGGTTHEDSVSARKYRPWDMNIHDWRRDNINRMVEALYDTIQAVKPWVYYGVAPFGIWTTDSTVALKEGLRLPPNIVGGNMYSELYCDPVAWVKGQYLDYLSPQLYWPLGSKQDYGILCRWWNSLCATYNIQMFPSLGVYRYNSGLYTVDELPNQMLVTRQTTRKNLSGFILFNTKGWSYDSALREHLQPLFSYPALLPAVGWKNRQILPMVSHLQLAGDMLFWKDTSHYATPRYVVYAIPNADILSTKSDNGGIQRLFNQAKYLIGVTYNTFYTIPKGDYTYAVSTIDRYNNEYSIQIVGGKPFKTKVSRLSSPKDDSKESLPVVFVWKGSKAVSYQFQLATDKAFQHIVFSTETTRPLVRTDNYSFLRSLKPGTYYWRVRTTSLNSNDYWTETYTLHLTQ